MDAGILGDSGAPVKRAPGDGRNAVTGKDDPENDNGKKRPGYTRTQAILVIVQALAAGLAIVETLSSLLG